MERIKLVVEGGGRRREDLSVERVLMREWTERIVRRKRRE